MTALAQRPRKLAVRDFLRFYETRPDEEQWQLIDGVALLMTPPLLRHQAITGTLQELLNEAARRTDASWRVYQRIGIELPEFPHYRPEPDVTVIDRDFLNEQRHASRFYLAAEVPSSTDEDRVDLKREFYRAHAPNRAILIVSQERIALELDRRDGEGWTTDELSGPDAVLSLPDFGLTCRLAELYRDTPLAPQA